MQRVTTLEGQEQTKVEEKAVKPDTKTKAKKRKKTSTDYAIEFFIKIAVTAAVVVLLCVFVVGIHVNHGNSSYPMIKDGDLVITYKIGKVLKGEEIAYKADGQTRFGRIVASAGDEVEIEDSCVLVNGFFVTEDVVYSTTSEGSTVSYPYKVPEDSVFVLNDFRDDISDSRTNGAVKLSDCEGKVVLVLRRRGI